MYFLKEKNNYMKINLERINDKYLFEVTNKNGHKVHLDRKYSDDYDVQGASPMELLLMGVAGCSSIDIISILEKQKYQGKKHSTSPRTNRFPLPAPVELIVLE